MTARQHEEQSAGRQHQATALALGHKVDITAFNADAAGTKSGQQPRKQYTQVPPALQARWNAAKRQSAEAERPAAMAAPAAQGLSAAAAAGSGRPQLPALRMASAATGVIQKPAIPTFKKMGPAAAGTAIKKAAAAGQKRAGGAKAGAKPAAPKRPKHATANAASTAASAATPGQSAVEAACAGAGEGLPYSAVPALTFLLHGVFLRKCPSRRRWGQQMLPQLPPLLSVQAICLPPGLHLQSRQLPLLGPQVLASQACSFTSLQALLPKQAAVDRARQRHLAGLLPSRRRSPAPRRPMWIW